MTQILELSRRKCLLQLKRLLLHAAKVKLGIFAKNVSSHQGLLDMLLWSIYLNGQCAAHLLFLRWLTWFYLGFKLGPRLNLIILHICLSSNFSIIKVKTFQLNDKQLCEQSKNRLYHFLFHHKSCFTSCTMKKFSLQNISHIVEEVTEEILWI